MSSPLNHDVIIRAATGLVRVCVRLYPRRFRAEYGSEIEALFRGRMLRASTAGTAPLMLALLSAFHDLLTGAVAERFPRRRMVAAERAAEERRDFMRISLLDIKLALRMTAKYPGLSAIAVCGLAVAIGLGAGYFAFVGSILDSTLPFEDGDRIVAIQSRSLRSSRTGGTPLEAVRHWRNDLRTIETLAAFSEHSRNLITEDGRTDIASVAAMSPSAFRLAGVAPALGRTIGDEDERPGATPVLVIGHDEWQRRFNGDASVIGRTMRVDDTVHTIVGVMPRGFGFPIRNAYWIPLRLDATGDEATREVHVMGRLPDGVSLAQARAEVATIGERMAAAFPHSHGDLRLHVAPYTRLHGSFSSGGAGV